MRFLRNSIYFILVNVLIFCVISPFVIFYGPFESLRAFTIEAIITSRHPSVVNFFLSQESVNNLLRLNSQDQIIVESVVNSKQKVMIDEENGIRIEEISGKSFVGKVMLVRNPKQVKVAISKDLGVTGQRLSGIVSHNKAIAGINAGGFYDPNAQGNGASPDGLVMVDGQKLHSSSDVQRHSVIGFDTQGQLILKELSVEDLSNQNIIHAITFYPYLILDSVPQITGDGGWGIAPRTGIGQKADGTVIFVVIDGRQPGWSMGATLRDLMNVFIEYGAVNASNLDGGSSSEMVYKGQIVNRLWNIFGERYIPTAFVVMPDY